MDQALNSVRVTRRHAFITLQYVLAIATALVALWQTNSSPFLAGLMALVWFWRCWVLSEADRGYHFNSNARWKRHTFFSNRKECWKVVTGPLVAVVMSSFIYIPQPWYAHHVVDRDGGNARYYTGMLHASLFVPGVDRVQNFFKDQSIAFSAGNSRGAYCGGNTNDGKRLTARIAVALHLPDDALPIAYMTAGSQGALQGMMEAEVCGRFAETVHRYAITQLPRLIAIEAGTVEERSGMNRLGVRYAGVIQIVDLHVDADQLE